MIHSIHDGINVRVSSQHNEPSYMWCEVVYAPPQFSIKPGDMIRVNKSELGNKPKNSPVIISHTMQQDRVGLTTSDGKNIKIEIYADRVVVNVCEPANGDFTSIPRRFNDWVTNIFYGSKDEQKKS